jgi:hypothetical protein
MTTEDQPDMTIEELDQLVESASDILRRRIDEMEAAKTSQPERLAKARSDAEEARGWALLEEPLDGQVSTLAGHNEYGDERSTLAIPNYVAKELWGARLAFDLLDVGDDYDEIDAVTSRLFAAAGGDPGVMMLIQAAALSTIASLIVPQLLDEIETRASNYNERVRLCEARAKAWNGRVAELREAQGDAPASQWVKPIDGFDIGAQALDPEADL